MLVAPDAGALKKTMELSRLAGMPYIHADKKRNPENGEITGTAVHSSALGNQDVLIVDDICDGGRTFVELAKELKTLTTGKIYLYVTHGIFSKGLGVFNGIIDHIYTAHVFPGVDLTASILTVVTGSE
jgi:ribose-phosphate pyrophosphokinase